MVIYRNAKGATGIIQHFDILYENFECCISDTLLAHIITCSLLLPYIHRKYNFVLQYV